MTESVWSDRLWRHRRWIVVAGLLLTVRAALPEVLRRILVSQASQALRAQVEIGDLDLAVLRGGVALEDVVVRPAPPAADSLAASATAAAEPPAAPAVVEWKRLAVRLRWLPLLQKTIRLREVVLDAPHLGLNRLQDGHLNALALLPASPEQPAAEPTPGTETPAGPRWGFGVDRFVVRGGGVRFHDLTLEDSEPIQVILESIDVAEIALRPGIYGEPSRLHVALAVDDGSLRLDGRLGLREGGIGFEADVEAQNLPLRRLRLYVPKVGWSALQGSVDATIAHRFESAKLNELRGTVTVRDLAVQVPGIEESALAWRSLSVKCDLADLLAQRVAVGEIELAGALLLMRSHGGDLLPFLAAAASRAPDSGAATAAPGSGSPGESSPAALWSWTVTSLRVADSRLRLPAAGAPLDIGVRLDANDLASNTDRPAHVELALTHGNGSVNVAGSLRVAPPGFAGTLHIADLALPELAAAAGAQSPPLLQAGRLASDLTIEAGLAVADGTGETVAPSDLGLQGRLSLAELRLSRASPQPFSAEARAIDLAVTDLRAAGVLAGTGPESVDLRMRGRLAVSEFALTGADPNAFAVSGRALDLQIMELSVPGVWGETSAASRPMRVAFGDLHLTGPSIQLMRTPEGLVLPQLATAAPPAEAPAAAGAPPRRVEVVVESVRVADGRVAVVDRTVKPFFQAGLAPLTIELRRLRWPQLALADLRVTAVGAEHSTIDVYGGLAPGNGWLEVNAEQIGLLPFNPYATRFSGYSIGNGTASVASKLSVQSRRYYAENWLTLHDFEVQGGAGESLFEQQFGVPLSLGLALMRDVHGDIVLGIPVQVDAAGAKVDVLSVISGALRRAIVNALTSPLKLVGAVFSGDSVKAATPAPIAFRTGRADLAPEGVRQIQQLAAFLASRPGLGVMLEAAPTAGDVRWLREQALRAEWEGQGILGALRGLPQRGTRETVRRALEVRAKDEPGELSRDDAAALDRWLEERPQLPSERLRALAAERLARTETILRDDHGIDAARITRRQPSADALEGAPAVRIQLGPAGT